MPYYALEDAMFFIMNTDRECQSSETLMNAILRDIWSTTEYGIALRLRFILGNLHQKSEEMAWTTCADCWLVYMTMTAESPVSLSTCPTYQDQETKIETCSNSPGEPWLAASRNQEQVNLEPEKTVFRSFGSQNDVFLFLFCFYEHTWQHNSTIDYSIRVVSRLSNTCRSRASIGPSRLLLNLISSLPLPLPLPLSLPLSLLLSLSSLLSSSASSLAHPFHLLLCFFSFLLLFPIYPPTVTPRPRYVCPSTPHGPAFSILLRHD